MTNATETNATVRTTDGRSKLCVCPPRTLATVNVIRYVIGVDREREMTTGSNICPCGLPVVFVRDAR